MPTLIGTTQRLELNQSSRSPLLEQLSGEKLVFWQGLSSRIECALFNDTPESSSFVSDVSNLDSVNLVVRKGGPTGDILFTQDVDVFNAISYSSWTAETTAQFTFSISELDTTQIVPSSGHLPIYFVVTAVTTEAVPYIAGFGYGEIVDVGFIENPVSSDYITGRTNIVGGKLLTNLDANNYSITNLPLSGVGYIETGTATLVNGSFTCDVSFLHEKVAASYVFTELYVTDSSFTPQFIEIVTKPVEHLTTGFRVHLSEAPETSNCKLVWGVAILDPSRASQPGTTGPRYILGTHALGPRVLYASRNSVVLDSNVLTGGGTDVTSDVNDLLMSLEGTGGTVVLDGPALSSGSFTCPSNVGIYCPNKSCGVFLAAGSNCPMVINSNYNGLTNPTEPSVGNRQKNISVIGGTWNGNYPNQSADVAGNPANAWVVGMWFNGVDDLYMDDVTIINARKFGLMVTYPGSYEIPLLTVKQDVQRTDNNDAFHVWGPTTGFGHIGTLRAINCSDDTLALNFCESRDPLNGNVDFTGRAAAIYTVIDNVFIYNGTSILRVDGTVANCGTIIVRNVFCLFTSTVANSALSITADGSWDYLYCPGWNVKIPSTVAESSAKGVFINGPRGGSITKLQDWVYTGDASISVSDSNNNALVKITPIASGTNAHKVILDNVIARKPTASPSGTLMLVTEIGAVTPTIDAVEIYNCSIKNYAYLYANDSGYAQVLSLDTDNNTLNGAASLYGVPPTNISDHDNLRKIAARVLVTSNLTLLNNTPQTILFGTEDYDTNNLHSVSSNTSRIVIPVTDYYALDVYAEIQVNTTGLREIRFVLNGATILKRTLIPPLTGENTTINCVIPSLKFNKNDYVEVVANQNSGGSLVLYAGAYFSVTRL